MLLQLEPEVREAWLEGWNDGLRAGEQAAHNRYRRRHGKTRRAARESIPRRYDPNISREVRLPLEVMFRPRKIRTNISRGLILTLEVMLIVRRTLIGRCPRFPKFLYPMKQTPSQIYATPLCLARLFIRPHPRLHPNQLRKDFEKRSRKSAIRATFARRYPCNISRRLGPKKHSNVNPPPSVIPRIAPMALVNLREYHPFPHRPSSAQRTRTKKLSSRTHSATTFLLYGKDDPGPHIPSRPGL
ncbi:hypothetical protein B0H15DRAFT_848453 [Mycena belliarum]|uniref:Uncharacterized protein n=1 Tax=Mycena belliarum TaxID=1033014 RepID=A0AAD6U4P6_9AGAR|nr:hypothetical protein B0H15DRAFT_848453 [Mycena belliae]